MSTSQPHLSALNAHKVGFIANYEGRAANSHILVLVRENIREFEAQQGKIEGEISPDVNVKPTAKLSGKKEAD